MLTETRNKPKVPANIETVDYPPDVIDRWKKEVEIAKLQIKTGELQPQTVKEFAAEFGIALEA